ncbi:rhodanese-like domain-containing protein [Desulfobacula sp.]|uniref:rhodanese-like domain-containing protein n=1 Tax=Desulfobacula sp. TaxID=2593537 RepID=UPI00262E76C8|nr:rhodanese-like domain-containing protein [Desulfobacula sp.]
MKKCKLYAIVMAFFSAMILTAQASMAADLTSQDMVAEAKKTICEVSVSEAKTLFDQGGPLFVDCRTSKEFKMGHIPGAMNIPRGLLEFKVSGKIPDKNTDIVMYCKKGGRGCLATCTLCRMGYKNATNMNGGWMAWEKAGYPVE